MQETNLDVNIIIQTFQEKIAQLTTDLVVKEATIKQLNAMLTQMSNHTHEDDNVKEIKKDK
jgi:uncharacterized coiled-coil protein SlyX